MEIIYGQLGHILWFYKDIFDFSCATLISHASATSQKEKNIVELQSFEDIYIVIYNLPPQHK